LIASISKNVCQPVITYHELLVSRIAFPARMEIEVLFSPSARNSGKKCSWATRLSFLGHTGFFWLFLAFFGRDEVFFVRDARRACRGATCRTACWDFRLPFHAMVGVVVGV